MATRPKKINQLDPFGETETEFSAQGIRRSRSRESRDLMQNVVEANPKGKKGTSPFAVVFSAVLVVIAVLLVVFLPKSNSADENFGDDPLVNPTGREATSEYIDASADDPDLRANEENKLSAVLVYIKNEDWESANASFETIFPRYLDTCGKYDYYRAAVSLANNFKNFSLPLETAETRRDALASKCSK
ncbi:hypothetical protein IKE71_00705 [Candidatus Saccharibacteria bacterium]|nr:hypothetical protein [Candidatus Saccharibacteria bacterium]